MQDQERIRKALGLENRDPITGRAVAGTAKTQPRLVAPKEEKKKPTGLLGAGARFLQVLDDIDKSGSDIILKTGSGLAERAGLPVTQFGIEDVEEKNWVLGALVRGAGSPLNLVPGLGVARGATMAARAGSRAATGAGFELGAQAVGKGVNYVIPEDLPMAGAIRAGVGIGTTAVLGRKATSLITPIETTKNLTARAIANKADPETIQVAAFMDNVAPSIRAGQTDLSPDFVQYARPIVEMVGGFSPENKKLAAHALRLVMNGDETLIDNGLKPLRGPKWMQNLISPIQGKEKWQQDALAQRNATVESMTPVGMAARFQLEDDLKRYFQVKEPDKIFTKDGKVDHPGIQLKDFTVPEALMFTPRHMLDEPQAYNFNPQVKPFIEKMRKSFEEMGAIEDKLGIKYRKISDYVPREWERELADTGERIVQPGARATFERERKFGSLREGVEAGLTPTPASFSDIFTDRYNQMVERLSQLEAERVAVADLPKADARTLVDLSAIKEQRKALSSQIGAVDKDLQSARRMFTDTYATQRRAARAAGLNVKYTEQRAGLEAERAQLRASEQNAWLAARKERVRNAVSRADGISSGLELALRNVQRIRGGAIDDILDLRQAIRDARKEITVASRTGQLKQARIAEDVLDKLEKRLYKTDFKNTQELQQVLEPKLARVEKLIGSAQDETPAMRLAAARAENAKTFDQAMDEMVNGIRLAAESKAPFPVDLVPQGVDVGPVQRAFDAMSSLREQKEKLLEQRKTIGRKDIDLEGAIAERRRQVQDMFRLDESVQGTQKFIDDTTRNIREAVLTLDLSAFSIQGLARFIEDPIRGTAEIGRAVRFLYDPDHFKQWIITEADGLADASRHGVSLFRGNTLERDLKSALPTKSDKTLIERTPFVGSFVKEAADRQFGRAVPFWKYQSWKYNTRLLMEMQGSPGFAAQIRKATGLAKVDKDMTLAEAKRIAADHVNNVFGGINPAKVGAGSVQRTMERLIILTPDYLRATLGVAASSTKGDAQGLLARHLLVQGFGLAAVTAMGFAKLQQAMGQDVPDPNLFRPDQKDWLFTQVGGRVLNPMARFRTLFRLGLVGPSELLMGSGDPGEATSKTVGALRKYGEGRYSIPLSIAESFATQKDFFGNPIRTETGVAGTMQEVTALGGQLLPIGIQQMIEEGPSAGSLAFGILGMSSFTKDPQETRAIAALTAAALDAGVPRDVVNKTLREGGNPIRALGEDGTEYLDAIQRDEALKAAVNASGMDSDVIQRLGRADRLLTVPEAKAVKSAQVDEFFKVQESIQGDYQKNLASIEQALAQTGNYAAYSRALTMLRAERRAKYEILYQKDGPFADVIEGFNDPKRLGERNVKEVVYQRFRDAINDPTFTSVGVDGSPEFDFRAQRAEMERQRDQLGDAVVDEFLGRMNRDKSRVELERDYAFEQILRPYFNLRDEVWQNIGGVRLAPDPETFEKLNADDPQAMMNPKWQLYQRMLSQKRRLMRLQNPELDRATSKWLGLKPVRGR